MSNNGVNDYLGQLREELAGQDPATIQDALSDAEEYLRSGIAQWSRENPSRPGEDAMQFVAREYGSPAEVAAAYKEIERRTRPALTPSNQPAGKSAAARFFGVFTDPRAYASLFYMFFALVTGIFYFTWVTAGLSLAAGLIVLIIGLPFLALFLLSIRGIALVEGRIVEALLGVRMPRRPMFSSGHLGIWARFKALFTDRRSWLPMIYMVLQLPLGIVYFTVFVTMMAFGLAGIASPILQYGFGLPIGQIGETSLRAPAWLMPMIVVVGVIWLLLTMHLARGLGQIHGRFAKAMLVK